MYDFLFQLGLNLICTECRTAAMQDDNCICPFQIGCSPGFEDGEFESAKFLRPAASFYDAAEDCLYIVDSEVIIHSRINPFFFSTREVCFFQ